MRCWCCDREIRLARKVKVRPWRQYDLQESQADAAAYAFYEKEMTYRWAVICQGCYARLDNAVGVAAIGTRMFNVAGASRGDRAPVLDEAKYQAFERRQAARMGLQL